MPRLLIAPSAFDDLDEIAAYIAEDNPQAAAAFLDRCQTECFKLAEMPGLGRERRDLVDQPLRFWPVGNYFMVYRASPELVEIVRVVSGYRHLPALFD